MGDMATVESATEYLKRARVVERELERAETEHEKHVANLKKARRRAWLGMNRAGMTYEEIADELGISDGLLCREISAAIREAPAHLAARPTPNGRRRALVG